MNSPSARKTPTSCRICGGSAKYSYFGAVVCQPCKMFFRRNAMTGFVSRTDALLLLECFTSPLLDKIRLLLRSEMSHHYGKSPELQLVSTDEMFSMWHAHREISTSANERLIFDREQGTSAIQSSASSSKSCSFMLIVKC